MGVAALRRATVDHLTCEQSVLPEAVVPRDLERLPRSPRRLRHALAGVRGELRYPQAVDAQHLVLRDAGGALDERGEGRDRAVAERLREPGVRGRLRGSRSRPG